MENKRHIQISVIMPVYNGEDHLKKALESLTNQTLQSFEIICVDDGSEDGTKEILERFCHKDTRIRILRQNHKGAGAARNLGLSEAKGTYVVFLDADDIFYENMLEKIAEKGKQTKADVILFGAKRYDDRTGEILETPWYLRKELLPKQDVFTAKDVKGQLLGITIPSPWTKAFRREFILNEEIYFQNLPNSNDVYFVFVALAAAKKVAAIKEDLLLYRVFREKSLQNQKVRYPLCFLDAYEAAYDEMHRRGIYEDVAVGFASSVLSGCVYNLNSMNGETVKREIEKTLCSERFTRMGLLDFPEEYYIVPDYRNQIAGLSYAQEVRRMVENNEHFEAEILVKKENSDKEKKVSVIVPVYNTQKYLKDCMDSIVGQTLQEIEIICIDDGSTDRSLDILCEYAEKDDRITIYRQKNSGLSVVRNRGLKSSSGKYIYFMDSDDILRPDALENLYLRSAESNLDVLYFNGITMYESDEIRKSHPEFEEYYLRKGNYPKRCEGTEMFLRMRGTGEYRVNMGIQFFRRSFLEEERLLFQPGILHEDNDFTFRSMLLAKRVGYTAETYFNRRVRAQSIMTTEMKFNHIYGYFKSFLKMLEFVENKDYPEEMTDTLFDAIYSVLNHGKKRYYDLSGAEKYAYLGLCPNERNLFRIFIEKDAETYAKLQRTYAEKSEINRKLQITYGEKYDRGLEIKRLRKELDSVKKSKSYKLARFISFPVRLLRRVIKRIRGEK